MNELIDLILGWASDRNLIKGSTAVNQFVKLTSEFGEIATAIRDRNEAEISDGIGDVFVVLVIIFAICDIDVKACCELVEFDENPVLDKQVSQSQMSLMVWSCGNLGRLGDSILKRDLEKIQILGVRVIRGLNRMAAYQGQELKQCVQMAYNEIKDRRGVMYNGTFIKSTDARYESAMAELAKAS